MSQVVRDISFDIQAGETLGIIGESGSGKSVSALAISGLLPQTATVTGQIAFQGKILNTLPTRHLEAIRGRDIGMIFQEPLTALNPLHTIERQIAEPLFRHQSITRTAAKARVLELLDMVELDNLKSRLGAYPHELSGGQRQRVMIAMALANTPALLIADEPTTALDVTVSQTILELLRKLQKELGLGILLITHDFGVIRRAADRVAVMQNGQIVETLGTEAFFKDAQHPYSRHLLSSSPKGSGNPFPEDAPILLEAKNFAVRYPIKGGLLRLTKGHTEAVAPLDITLRRGETLGIVGESGSGKSSLVYGLLGLTGAGTIPPESTRTFEGQDLNALSPKQLREWRARAQIIFQDPYGALSPRLSVGEIIGEGFSVHQPSLPKPAREAAIVTALADVGLEADMQHRYPHEFSGGQRQRIAIARALVLRPQLLILDEPTSALDLSTQAQILELLKGLQHRHGLSYIFISHDLAVIKAIANSLLVLKDGRVMERGSATEILTNPKSPYTKALLEAAFL